MTRVKVAYPDNPAPMTADRWTDGSNPEAKRDLTPSSARPRLRGYMPRTVFFSVPAPQISSLSANLPRILKCRAEMSNAPKGPMPKRGLKPGFVVARGLASWLFVEQFFGVRTFSLLAPQMRSSVSLKLEPKEPAEKTNPDAKALPRVVFRPRRGSPHPWYGTSCRHTLWFRQPCYLPYSLLCFSRNPTSLLTSAAAVSRGPQASF